MFRKGSTQVEDGWWQPSPPEEVNRAQAVSLSERVPDSQGGGSATGTPAATSPGPREGINFSHTSGGVARQCRRKRRSNLCRIASKPLRLSSNAHGNASPQRGRTWRMQRVALAKEEAKLQHEAALLEDGGASHSPRAGSRCGSGGTRPSHCASRLRAGNGTLVGVCGRVTARERSSEAQKHDPEDESRPKKTYKSLSTPSTDLALPSGRGLPLRPSWRVTGRDDHASRSDSGSLCE